MRSKSKMKYLIICSISVWLGILTLSVPGQAQEKINVSGIVRNSDGAPLSGVNVRVKGQPHAETATGANGNFSLPDVPLKSILILTSMGYESAHGVEFVRSLSLLIPLMKTISVWRRTICLVRSTHP